ncbi:MAG: alpha/beta hydrolase [Gammaproteobacteria bacterium]|nr:alpha/beta hydrolase [Gammaproteobacteria bacterium]
MLSITTTVFYGLKAEANVWQPSANHQQIAIWPKGKMPDAIPITKAESMRITKGLIAGKPVIQVLDVTQPTITIYSPTTKNTGAAVIVFPGGGFHGLAMDLEGTEICEWLASEGITGILLKYRVPNSGPNWNDDCHCHVKPYAPAALEDAQRALGIVRLNAEKWHINPNKIGVIGFSAGGFMVADISTHFNKRAYASIDAADKESCRPDFAIALYPGHMGLEDNKAFALNPAIHFTKDTPPTFLLQAENDPMDTIDNSLLYYIGLKNVGAPVEMHLYAQGGHAFGLRSNKFPITNWPQLVKTWLGTIGMISR